MAFENVNPLRAIWRGLGLEYILLEGEAARARAREIRTAPPAASRAAPAQTRPRTAPASSASRPTAGGKRPERGRERFVWKPLPREAWPALWLQCLGKDSPRKLAWTYWKLGSDLLQGRNVGGRPYEGLDPQGRKGRGDFINGLVRDLGNPPGTHAFWPAALPGEGGALEPNPEIFWSAASLRGVKGVVILGSKAASALLGRNDLKPLDQELFRGCLVWVGWDIDGLIASPDKRSSFLAYLKRWINTVI